MSTFQPTTPLSVSDINMSSAYVVNGLGEGAIRTTGGGSSAWSILDVSQVVDTLGDVTDADTENTVIGLLKRIAASF